MKRKIGTCAVISFVLSGMGLVSFLFTFFNYCRYGSLKAVPSGGGGYTAQHVFSRGNIPALLYMAVIIALSAVTAAAAWRSAKEKTRLHAAIYMAGCFVLGLSAPALMLLFETELLYEFTLLRAICIGGAPVFAIFMLLKFVPLLAAGILAVPYVIGFTPRTGAAGNGDAASTAN